MTVLEDFMRVTKRIRCPICERPDWCLIDRKTPESPARVICARVESPHRFGDAGWLHRLSDDGHRAGRSAWTLAPASSGTAFARLAQDLERAMDPDLLHGFAHELGVSVESLRNLGVGLARGDDLGRVGLHGGAAWVFPMRTADLRVCGLRLRFPGRKLAVRGSRNGLFVPTGQLSARRLFVAEGESDTAALLTLGVSAVGRPGCSNGARFVNRVVRSLRVRETVIVADADPAGQDGALRLARTLRAYCPLVRVLDAPDGAKDVRAWIGAGAQLCDLEAAVSAANVVEPPSIRRVTP